MLCHAVDNVTIDGVLGKGAKPRLFTSEADANAHFLKRYNATDMESFVKGVMRDVFDGKGKHCGKSYDGQQVWHASHGVPGKNQGLTLFWWIAGRTGHIFAAGHHVEVKPGQDPIYAMSIFRPVTGAYRENFINLNPPTKQEIAAAEKAAKTVGKGGSKGGGMPSTPLPPPPQPQKAAGGKNAAPVKPVPAKPAPPPPAPPGKIVKAQKKK